jgi:opacity protein-like surface antigen
MRKLALFCGLFLALAIPAMAQDHPRVEFFGGYSFLRQNVDNIGLGGTGYSRLNYKGASGSIAYNFSSWLGVVGDLGGYRVDQSITISGFTGSVNTSMVTYMLGPKITFRTRRFSPFAQALFGGARIADSLITTGTESEFAYSVGGGVDYNLTHWLGIRPIQAEYLKTQFKDGNNNKQSNARLSAGIVLRF